MRSHGVKTVLVGGVGQGDGLAVGGFVREPALSGHGWTFGTLGLG